MNLEIKLAFILCACAVVHSAPRRSSSTTFDQKQTGEYNIQLHLKDFQIIAVVGDDSFGTLGDYDYNYDYSDFTVKPSSSSSTTTKKPTFPPEESSTSSSTTQKNDITLVEFASVGVSSKPTSKKPLTSVTHPYPIVSPSTTVKPFLTTTRKPITEEPVTKPSLPSVNGSTPAAIVPEESEKVSTSPSATASSTPAPSTTVKLITSTLTLVTTKKVVTRPASAKPHTSLATSPIPGQIPVVVQEFSIIRNETPIVKVKNSELSKDKRGEGVTNVTIVPLDDSDLGELSANEQPALGEILHYRRCAQGYQRDKRGRCRKVRRPQIPLGLTRFASNFAARLRQTGTRQSESDENRDATDV